MKIGIDTRLLSRPLTGIGHYTLAMCHALAKIPDISLRLYSPDLIRPDISALESVTAKSKNWNNLLLRQLWSETFLPWWAKNDDVDLFWGPAHRLPRLLPKQMARVVTIHDLVWKYLPQTMRLSTRLLETCHMPFAIRSADHIVAVSQATADAVIKEFCVDPKKLTVVSEALCVSRVARTSEMAGITKDELFKKYSIKQPYFLFVGTLEPRKNLFRLLEAYSKLPEVLRNKASLVIVGGKGWGDVNLVKTIEEFGLKNHVRLLGYVDDSTLLALYANCLFLAMPSLYEGFGLPIVEAMSYGKPVLTSNNSSMPEVAGDAGFFIDPLSTDSILDGLEKMMNDTQLRVTLASKAKASADRFDWDRSAKKLVEVFGKAVRIRRDSLK